MSIQEMTYYNQSNYNQSNNASEPIDTLKEAVEYLQNKIELGISEMDDPKVKESFESRIYAKLESGKRLTAKELRYLRKYNPAMYANAIRIEAKRRGVEERLKHANSKREVEEIQFVALSTISKKDPVRHYMIAAVNENVKEFKKTGEYRRLPEGDEKDKNLFVTNICGCFVDKKQERVEVDISVKYEFETGFYQMAYAEDRGAATRFSAIS